MRLSLIILVAALFLACSPKQNEADTVMESDPSAVNSQEDASAASSTALVEPATTSQEEPTVVPSATVPTGPSKAQTTSSTAAVKPDVELAAASSLSVEKVDGPTLTEKPSIPAAAETKAPVLVEEEVVAVAAPKSEPDHSIWDNLLRNFVSSTGQVNYRGIKNSRTAFDSYITELESFSPQSDWSRNQIMAYWINAYNAYTIKLIVDNHPVGSIKDIHGGNPWEVKWIKIGGSSYSLNQIENDILRARYGDARIHFAVNCAAASCPPIHNRAFTAENLNSTLQRLTRKFINNTNYNTITAERIEISKIFDWYGGDFGDVKSYINGFTEVELGEQTEVNYKEYDWALNGR